MLPDYSFNQSYSLFELYEKNNFNRCKKIEFVKWLNSVLLLILIYNQMETSTSLEWWWSVAKSILFLANMKVFQFKNTKN